MAGYTLFFVEGDVVPSTRFRVRQFLAAYSPGKIRVLSTWPSKYLFYPNMLRGSVLLPVWAALLLLVVIFTRFVQILLFIPSAHTVFLQRDFLHRVNIPLLEMLLFAWGFVWHGKDGIRYIFDFDDAIFLDRAGSHSEALKKKIGKILSGCQVAIAGNTYLADFASAYCPAVIIPTTIDCERFVPRPLRSESEHKRPITIGWTGTRSNLHYLVELEPVFLKLRARYDVSFVVICDGGAALPFSSQLDAVEMIAWKEEREVQDLWRIDIGLMPLKDSEWARGKCGFKLLQYMAVGIPAVASPVGVNPEIVRHEENGYLAASLDQWHQHLSFLIEHSEARARMGRRAREFVLEHYATKVWLPRWREVVGL